MNIQSADRAERRFIVDIDGCLRATESRCLTARDIAALHGRLADDTCFVWEQRGESILIGQSDCVELDENNVAFFRTCRRVQTFRSPLAARDYDRTALAA